MEERLKTDWSRAVVPIVAVTILALWLAVPRPVDGVLLGIGAIFTAGVIVLGVLAAMRFGRGAAFVKPNAMAPDDRDPRARRLILAVLLGLALGAALMAVLLYGLAPLEPALAARLRARAVAPLWMPAALAFESAVLEEVVFRLFLLSGLVWLLARGWRRGAHGAAPSVVWTAIGLSSLAFGCAHLPAWLGLTRGTPLLVGVVLGLNGIAGIALGQVYWWWGLEAAVACHFAADLIVQGLGPRLA